MKGLIITPLRVIPTQKGSVLHGLKASEPAFRGFGEAYFSAVSVREIKGWKRHHRMILNIIVPTGEVRFVFHDDRPSSLTEGKFAEVVLGPPRHYARLTVEPGLWFAFQGHGPNLNLLLNIASMEHDPAEVDQKPIEEIPYRW